MSPEITTAAVAVPAIATFAPSLFSDGGVPATLATNRPQHGVVGLIVIRPKGLDEGKGCDVSHLPRICNVIIPRPNLLHRKCLRSV